MRPVSVEPYASSRGQPRRVRAGCSVRPASAPEAFRHRCSCIPSGWRRPDVCGFSNAMLSVVRVVFSVAIGLTVTVVVSLAIAGAVRQTGRAFRTSRPCPRVSTPRSTAPLGQAGPDSCARRLQSTMSGRHPSRSRRYSARAIRIPAAVVPADLAGHDHGPADQCIHCAPELRSHRTQLLPPPKHRQSARR